MTILIDPPRWPAHGTVFSHLVSDESLNELHAFAADAGLPPAAFDHDHYDVPERNYAELVARGAVEVSSTGLVRRLIDSGLRVRALDRTPKRTEVLPRLRGAWAGLVPTHPHLGAELLDRWSEPHRHYHDVRHLAYLLDALQGLGCTDAVVHLAGWFHDAVYAAVPGDEEASAKLAEDRLAGVVPDDDRAEVARLVRMTEAHDPGRGDVRGTLLCDADLAILAASPARYGMYTRDIRIDYQTVPDRIFVAARRRVIEGLLARDRLFLSDRGHELWERRARLNLADELHLIGRRA